jgi:CHAT domain-containing protein
MPSTERAQRDRPLPPSYAGQTAGSATPEADLLSVRRDFPAFRIWREITGDRIRYVARRRQPGTQPHTVVTSDPRELRAVLADSSQPVSRTQSGTAPDRAERAGEGDEKH